MTTLNLKEIFKRRTKFIGHYRLNPSQINLPADVGEVKEPVDVHLEITKEKGGYRVHISIKGEVLLECSRCLSPFYKDISQIYSLRVQHYPSGDRVYLKPQDLDVSFYEDEEHLDVAQLVREQIILNIPIKPLCSPECSVPFLLQENTESPFSALKKLLNI